MLGEKLSIVTPLAQTTRDKVLGIFTTEDAQIVFVDTPGLLEPAYALHRSMLEAAYEAIRDVDVVLLLLDPTRPDQRPGPEALGELKLRLDVLQVAINKTDIASADAVQALTDWAGNELGKTPILISATTNAGVDELRDRLIAALPASPFFIRRMSSPCSRSAFL